MPPPPCAPWGSATTLYDGIVTSGEVTHALLRDRSDPAFAALGRRLFHIGPERDRNVFDTLDVESVAEPAEATFVLNTGPDDSHHPTEIGPWEATLRACRDGAGCRWCAPIRTWK